MSQEQQRYNESGYPIKECQECKRDININSFSKIDPNLCVSCYEDINDVKVWEYTEGDFNDVFEKSIIKATGKQIRQYCLELFIDFEDRKDEIEDINGDGIGFIIYYPEEIDPETNEPYEDQEIRIELYNEAREIEDYNGEDIDHDLTKYNNEDNGA